MNGRVVLCALGALGMMGASAAETPLDRFWDSTKGQTVRRLPVQVVPENVFISLSGVTFDRPEGDLEARIAREVGAAGTYNVVTLTLRSIPDLTDAITRERAAAFIRAAHAEGMQVLMDIDARIARFEFLRRWPEDHAGVMRTGVFTPTNGVAAFSLGYESFRDHMAWGSRAGYDPLEGRVVRAFAVKEDGVVRRDVTAAVAAAATTTSNLVSGTVGNLAPDERLVVLAAFKMLAVDPCSTHLTPFLADLAEVYHKLGADGAMRDEWGFLPMGKYARMHTAFPYTKRYAELYAQTSGGRDYVEDLALIAYGAKGRESERARAIDFLNRTTYDRITRTEQEFYDFNKRIFGPDVYVTKHPTWYTSICPEEFLHDGLDWWSAARDWAQSDESVPIPCVNGMAKRRGGPTWMNEGYGPDPEHYGYAVWRYALCGGRMVYHGIYSGGETSVSRRKLPPVDAKMATMLDILTPGNVRAQSRVRLLNLISRAQMDAPTALVFGHARTLNWLDPAFADAGLALAHALAGRGHAVDVFPSSELASFTVDPDGALRMGQQRYTALILHRVDADDIAAFTKLVNNRPFTTALFGWDQPLSIVEPLTSGTNAAPIAAFLERAHATRQTPLTKRGLTRWSSDRLPAPDGTLTLLDGTVARIKGCSPNFAGDPIWGTLTAGGVKIDYSAEGVFAARVDRQGALVALAAGGLRHVSLPGFTLKLDAPEDVVLVKRDGKWRGLWQTATPSAPLPAPLAALTDDWRTLVLPAQVAADAVKVSSFGFNAEDSTEIIQKALDSGAPKLVFDKQSGPWITRPLVARSNQEIVFEDGVELVAKKGEFRGIRDYLFRCENVSNLVIRGNGPKGGTFRMHKKDYQQPPYEKGEWRYTLRLCGVENVLVENMHFVSSGGDGIVIGAFKGKSSKNVTVRNCVCDDNHRQGISLCGGEDILLEDVVLSNTCGTPPQAGIDFEPDRPCEKLARVTLRNVLSKNNAGAGFDFYFTQMRDWSEPVSITLENCRSVGNSTSVSLTADNKHDEGVVKGFVTFRKCSFEDAKRGGVHVCGIPAGAVDVTLTDCVISNAAPESKSADVQVSSGTSRQGLPDGVALKNLTVFQPQARPWFAHGRSSFGPAPKRIEGDVTVVAPDGVRTKTVLDAAWVAKNMPVCNGGRMPAPRVGLPRVKDVTVRDAKPGELVDLPPLALIRGAHYLLFVEKPGWVKLVLHQIDAVGNRPATTKPTLIRHLPDGDGKGRVWKVPTPAFEPGEIAFEAKEAGFYALELPEGGTRQQLLKSSVPVGIDVTKSEQTVAGVKGKPFSLWFYAPGGKPFTLNAVGDDYYRFKMALTDSAGKTVVAHDVVSSLCVTDVAAGQAAQGLWRADFARAKEPHYDWIRLELSGIPGCLFLTTEKTWQTK